MGDYKYKYTRTSNGNAAAAWSDRQPFFRLDALVNVATVITDGSGTLDSTTKITAAESIAVLDIPANSWVINVITRIITASTDGTATVDVGDGTDVAGWDAAVDITATAGTNSWSNNADDAYNLQLASGKVYTDADTLEVLFNNDTTNGIILFQMVIMELAYIDDP